MKRFTQGRSTNWEKNKVYWVKVWWNISRQFLLKIIGQVIFAVFGKNLFIGI